jgi:hypothetical protein
MHDETKDPIIQSEKSAINFTSQENVEKTVVVGEYYNIYTMEYHPITNNFFKNEAILLREWAQKEDSLRFTDFYDIRGYDRPTFYYWTQVNDEMKLAFEFARRRIASRREHGAITRKFSETAIFKTLGYYDHVYREEDDRVQAQKAKFAEQSESKVVVIERFPSQAYVEEHVPSDKTPEQVAAKVRKQTGDNRTVYVSSDILEKNGK